MGRRSQIIHWGKEGFRVWESCLPSQGIQALLGPESGPLPRSTETRGGGSLKIAFPLPPVAPSPPHPMAQPRPLWGGCGEERPLVGPFIMPEAWPMPAPSTGWILLPGGASQPPPATITRSPALSFPGALGLWPWSRLKDGGEPRPPQPPHLAIHTLAPEPWERWTAAGHRCPALPTPSPADLREKRGTDCPPKKAPPGWGPRNP